jgi:hypothetical protein
MPVSQIVDKLRRVAAVFTVYTARLSALEVQVKSLAASDVAKSGEILRLTQELIVAHETAAVNVQAAEQARQGEQTALAQVAAAQAAQIETQAAFDSYRSQDETEDGQLMQELGDLDSILDQLESSTADTDLLPPAPETLGSAYFGTAS